MSETLDEDIAEKLNQAHLFRGNYRLVLLLMPRATTLYEILDLI